METTHIYSVPKHPIVLLSCFCQVFCHGKENNAGPSPSGYSVCLKPLALTWCSHWVGYMGLTVLNQWAWRFYWRGVGRLWENPVKNYSSGAILHSMKARRVVTTLAGNNWPWWGGVRTTDTWRGRKAYVYAQPNHQSGTSCLHTQAELKIKPVLATTMPCRQGCRELISQGLSVGSLG